MMKRIIARTRSYIHAPHARIQVGKMAAIAGGRRYRRETSKRRATRNRAKGYSGDPKVGYPLDDVVTLLEVGLAQLVVLLLDLQDLVAGLLVQAIDLILTAVDLLERLLYLDVVVTRVPLARARVLQLLGLLVRRRHVVRSLLNARSCHHSTRAAHSVYFSYAIVLVTPLPAAECAPRATNRSHESRDDT